LAAIDEVLAQKPRKDDRRLSEAMMCLTRLREELTRRHRGAAAADPHARRQLDHLNAVISVVMGVHFPLGEIPWDDLEKGRGWLADLAAETG
jgi:hypothetical protein